MKFQVHNIMLLFFCAIGLVSNAQDRFETFTKNDGLTSSSILFTYVDSKGVIWAATKEGLNAFTGKDWIPIESILGEQGGKQKLGKVEKIFEATNTHLWIATEKGVFVYNRENWVYYADRDNMGFFVTHFFEDGLGRIWVLSEKKGGMKAVSELGFFMVDAEIQMFNGWQWFDFTEAIGGSAAIKLGDPSEYFTSIIQSDDGNIWLSTMDGLYEYNGEKWTTYNREVLPSDRCRQVFESTNKDIWVATTKGVTKKDGNNWMTYDDIKGLANYIPYKIVEDSKNRIWVLSRQGAKVKSLAFYLNDTWKIFSEKEIRRMGELTLFCELEGKMLTYSNQGPFLFVDNKWHDLMKLNNLKTNNFSENFFIKDNVVFFASGTNLYQLKGDSLKTLFSPLEDWEVTSIFIDSRGGIWVGTHRSGLYYIDHQKQNHFTKDSGLEDNAVVFIFEDKRSQIWVVTENGISRFIPN